MLRALDEFEIGGVTTLLGFHRALLRHPCFVDGRRPATGSSSRRSWPQQAAELAAAAGATARRLDGRRGDRARSTRSSSTGAASTSGARARAAVARAGHGGAASARPSARRLGGARRGRQPDAGHRARGEGRRRRRRCAPGQVICIVEAMKMENEIGAHRDGVVAGLSVAGGPGGRDRPGDLRRRRRGRRLRSLARACAGRRGTSRSRTPPSRRSARAGRACATPIDAQSVPGSTRPARR